MGVSERSFGCQHSTFVLWEQSNRTASEALGASTALWAHGIAQLEGEQYPLPLMHCVLNVRAGWEVSHSLPLVPLTVSLERWPRMATSVSWVPVRAMFVISVGPAMQSHAQSSVRNDGDVSIACALPREGRRDSWRRRLLYLATCDWKSLMH